MSDKKKVARKKRGRHKSPFKPIEDVVGAAKECKRLLDKGIIALELRYPNEVHFRINEEQYKLLRKSEETDKRFRSLLGEEITKGLVTALTGDISGHFPPAGAWGDDVDPDRYKEEVERIKAEVGAILCDERLRSWHRIKNSAKSHVLQSIDWEINIKRADRAIGSVKSIPHAIVRLWVRKPEEDSTLHAVAPRRFFFPFWLFGSEQDECYLVDMHEQDIRSLISEMNKIVDTLRSITAEQGEESDGKQSKRGKKTK